MSHYTAAALDAIIENTQRDLDDSDYASLDTRGQWVILAYAHGAVWRDMNEADRAAFDELRAGFFDTLLKRADGGASGANLILADAVLTHSAGLTR